MENNLPKSWREVQLEDILISLESGSRPKGGVRGITEGIPSVGGEHLNDNGGFDFTNIKYVPIKFASRMNRGQIKLGDVLIVKDGATTGKTSFVNENFPYPNAVVNEHVFICRTNPEINSKYLFYFLWSKEGKEKIMENFKGSAQGGINTGFISNLLIPIAPKLEQERIVAKLDAIMQKLEANKQRLEKIPKLLKRFRQAVLAAAVSGRLTEEWRDVKGVVEEWRETILDDCISELRNGLGKKPNIDPPGIKILRISAVRAGYVDISDVRYYNSKENNIENFILQNDDLLFTRYNGSIEFLGVCGLVSGLEDALVYPDKLMRVRVKSNILSPAYCELYFQSDFARDEILKYAKSSAGQNGISGGDLKKVIVHLPSLNEQMEIIRRIERLFAFADKIETRYLKAKAMLDRLPQSILGKAFRGELVPQDPGDEPASALLERIRTEKAERRKGNKQQIKR